MLTLFLAAGFMLNVNKALLCVHVFNRLWTQSIFFWKQSFLWWHCFYLIKKQWNSLYASIQRKCLLMWDSLLSINLRSCCNSVSSKCVSSKINFIMYICENINKHWSILLLGYKCDKYYLDTSKNLNFLNLWWMTAYQAIKTIR